MNRTAAPHRTALLALSCLLLLAGASLLTACGSAPATQPEQEETPDEGVARATPIPTISGTIAGCEIGPKAECPGADFSDQDLGEIVLGWQQLDEYGREGADFTEANLRGALFVGTNLEGISFEGADLRDANFRLANLTNASLYGADAAGADFADATLESGEFKEANLSGAEFNGAVMKGGDFSRADLSGASLRGVSLLGAFLTDADLSGADLTDANLTFADLGGANLEGAIFCNTKMSDGKINSEGCP